MEFCDIRQAHIYWAELIEPRIAAASSPCRSGVSERGLEPSKFSRQTWQALTGNVTSEITEDNWERGCE